MKLTYAQKILLKEIKQLSDNSEKRQRKDMKW